MPTDLDKQVLVSFGLGVIGAALWASGAATVGYAFLVASLITATVFTITTVWPVVV